MVGRTNRAEHGPRKRVSSRRLGQGLVERQDVLHAADRTEVLLKMPEQKRVLRTEQETPFDHEHEVCPADLEVLVLVVLELRDPLHERFAARAGRALEVEHELTCVPVAHRQVFGTRLVLRFGGEHGRHLQVPRRHPALVDPRAGVDPLVDHRHLLLEEGEKLLGRDRLELENLDVPTSERHEPRLAHLVHDREQQRCALVVLDVGVHRIRMRASDVRRQLLQFGVPSNLLERTPVFVPRKRPPKVCDLGAVDPTRDHDLGPGRPPLVEPEVAPPRVGDEVSKPRVRKLVCNHDRPLGANRSGRDRRQTRILHAAIREGPGRHERIKPAPRILPEHRASCSDELRHDLKRVGSPFNNRRLSPHTRHRLRDVAKHEMADVEREQIRRDRDIEDDVAVAVRAGRECPAGERHHPLGNDDVHRDREPDLWTVLTRNVRTRVDGLALRIDHGPKLVARLLGLEPLQTRTDRWVRIRAVLDRHGAIRGHGERQALAPNSNVRRVQIQAVINAPPADAAHGFDGESGSIEMNKAGSVERDRRCCMKHALLEVDFPHIPLQTVHHRPFRVEVRMRIKNISAVRHRIPHYHLSKVSLQVLQITSMLAKNN